MIHANWKDGKLTVSVLKGLPGIVLIQRTGNRLSSLNFFGGTGRQVVGMRDRPLSVQLVPAAQAEENYAEDAGMLKAELPQGEHKTPPKGKPKDQSSYAAPGYDFPVDTEKHVHAALAYFTKHKWPSAEAKRSAARKIMAAARKHGIKVSPDDNVARAAGGKD